MKNYLLGIDVGTTGTKSLLFSSDGVLLGHAYRPYDTSIPMPLYSEQNPQDWWNAVCETIREAGKIRRPAADCRLHIRTR